MNLVTLDVRKEESFFAQISAQPGNLNESIRKHNELNSIKIKSFGAPFNTPIGFAHARSACAGLD